MVFGLNVNNPISSEIKDIAINLKSLIKKDVSVETVTATLCYNLYQPLDVDYYKNNLLFMGEEVTVITDKSSYKAIISHVSDNGNLILKDGTSLSSAEVSIR